MQVHKLLRTTTFRLALVYLLIFATSAVALLAFILFTTRDFLRWQADQTIEAELNGLEEQYKRRGLPGLRQIIIERGATSEQTLYLLANSDRSRIAGNLTSWPPGRIAAGGWLEFDFQRPVEEGTELHPARAHVVVLPGNFWLLVGRDTSFRALVQAEIERVLFLAGPLVIAIGVAGGFIMSRRFLRRLEDINRTSRDIMAGDLSQRVPVSGKSDEIDELSRNLNSMLDQIERLMSGMRDVADNIAHDLRTPLNRMRSRLEDALRQPHLDPGYRQVLEQTVKEADGLIATFNALLLIAEAESGSARDTTESFDLSKSVQDAVELYEPLAEERKIRIAFFASPGLRLRGSRSLVSQAIANLLDNAIKYSPENSEVRVGVLQDARGPMLIVADRGPGIPEADRERVLERFVRLEASRSAHGTGLGLSLVAAVARMHDAELTLSDNGPGLVVKLLFHQAANVPAPRAPAQPRHASG